MKPLIAAASFLLCMSLAFGHAARPNQAAKPATTVVRFDAKQRLEVKALREFHLIGKAHLETDALSLDADRIIITRDKSNAIDAIRATGGVVRVKIARAATAIGTGASQATCSQATYKANQKQLLLDGPVHVEVRDSGAIDYAEIDGSSAVVELNDDNTANIVMTAGDKGVTGKIILKDTAPAKGKSEPGKN